MSLRSHLFAQFRQPSGRLGALAGWIMAHRPSNRKRNRWTVDLLRLAPSDRVLELGFGPGFALAETARRLGKGKAVGLDHSEAMLAQAVRRNRHAIRRGHVELHLGGLERLPEWRGRFDKIYSVNVMQFVGERIDALAGLRQALVPGGLLATTYQPRHQGANSADADAFALRLTAEMKMAGFVDVHVQILPLRPVAAVCVLGYAG